MKWNPHTLAAATQGTLHTFDPELNLVPVTEELPRRKYLFSIDTRTIQADEIFVALQGEQSDGHAYLEAAFRNGAAGVIVSDLKSLSPSAVLSERRNSGQTPFVLHVDEPLQALQAIARANRQKHPIPAAGVTGSNGKTTVKDMTAAILSTQFNVVKSHKSFNNHIGLPLTLANMIEEHDVAILEMGMNAPGELTELAGIAQPDVGIITNIAPAHFGFFHSLDAIMQAKMELLRALPNQSVAVLNADDELFKTMCRDISGSLVTFGLSTGTVVPTITAHNVQAAADASFAFDLDTPDGSIDITLPLPGRHNVLNALAAAAIIYALAQTDAYQRIESQHAPYSKLAMIKRGLEHFAASPMRMQVVSLNGVTFMNDAYNANPHSMASALRTLTSAACSGKKIAVLGDMFELGEISASAHAEVGARTADVPVDNLFLLGEYAADMSQGAQKAGMAASNIVIAESHAELAALIADVAASEDIVLLKASRGMTLERVLNEYTMIVKRDA